VIVPIRKLVKQFDDYPNDPHRGHDLISAVLTYRLVPTGVSAAELRLRGLDDQPHVAFLENLFVKLPHIDFSMPFNIICMISMIVGYMYINIFKLSCTKLSKEAL